MLELEYIPKILELLKTLEKDDCYSLEIFTDFSVTVVNEFDREITKSNTLVDTYFELLEQMEKNNNE